MLDPRKRQMCAAICKEVSEESEIPFSMIVAKTYLKGKVAIARKEAQRRAVARVGGATRRDVAEFFSLTPRRLRASEIADDGLYRKFFPSLTASASLPENTR